MQHSSSASLTNLDSMVSVAFEAGSIRTWAPHHDLDHPHRSWVDCYDRLQDVVVMKKYVRRRRQAGRKAAAAMVAATQETLRLCSDCRTSNTPLWRSGPAGPKSLCNACGIRHRRRKRADLSPREINAEPSAGGGNGQLAALREEEELKQWQREKQKRMLMVLLQRQREREREARRRPASVAVGSGCDGGKDEVEHAARLLLSLSSATFVQ